LRTLRTLLVVPIVLGAFVACSAGAGASVPAASTPSPKFCQKYPEVTKQLNRATSGSNYDSSSVKSLPRGLSELAKLASGKLRSDINKMASYFTAVTSQRNPLGVGKFLASHQKLSADYAKAATNLLAVGRQCVKSKS
jgi:hypothetical protein